MDNRTRIDKLDDGSRRMIKEMVEGLNDDQKDRLRKYVRSYETRRKEDEE